MRLPFISVTAANKTPPKDPACSNCCHDPSKCRTTPEYVLRAFEAWDVESLRKSREIILRILSDSHKERLDAPEFQRRIRDPLSGTCLAEMELDHVNQAISAILAKTWQSDDGVDAFAKQVEARLRLRH